MEKMIRTSPPNQFDHTTIQNCLVTSHHIDLDFLLHSYPVQSVTYIMALFPHLFNVHKKRLAREIH